MDKSTPHPEHPSQWKRDALTRARELAEYAEAQIGNTANAVFEQAVELGRLWAMIASVEDNRAMHTEAVERQDAMSAAMLDAMTEGMVEMPPMDTSSSPDFFVADPPHPELPFDAS